MTSPCVVDDSAGPIISLGTASCDDQYYDEIREYAQDGHEEWAEHATCRYTRVSE